MNIEELRDHCLVKPGVTEGLPFGDDTLVFKVSGKMFMLMSIKDGDRFNVKCDPELAIELRERHPEVQPGFHMSKTHWNTVHTDGGLTRNQLIEMVDHSYDLILKSLSKKQQEEISKME